MPIPKPSEKETKDEFVSRCISVLSEEDKDKSKEQIVAICFDTWNEHHKSMQKEEKNKDVKKETKPKIRYKKENQIICSTGVWNDTTFTKESLIEGLKRTEFDSKNTSLYLNHDDDEVEDWVGYVEDIRLSEDGEHILGTLVVIDEPTAEKLSAGAPFGISPSITIEEWEDEEEKILKSFVINNWSVVVEQAIEDATINENKKKFSKEEEDNFKMDKEKLNNLFEEIKKSPEKRNELLLNFLKEELDYEPEGEKKEFKEWDTAFINDLPDIAFAYVEKGEKDEEGKTVPRTNRHLPHHGMNVKSATENDSVDLPHLRNALARLPQTNLSEEAKAKAKAHLEAHARALGVGEREEKSEAPEEPSKDKEELSQSVVSEYKKLLELNEEIINKLEEVSKETLVREKQIQDYEKSISDLRTRLSVFEAERKEKKARAFARKVEQTAKLYCELLGSEGEDALNSAKEMFSKFSEEKLESECARLESRKIAKMSAEPDVVTKSSVEKREVPKPVAKFQEVDTSKMDKKEKTDYLYKKLVNLYGG